MPVLKHPPLDTLTQDHAAYTTEDHEVWGILSARRMTSLVDDASERWLDGAARINLPADRVPDLAQLNTRLTALTGWSAVGVRGFVPAGAFFASLAGRRFPTTLIVRPRAQLDYLPEPDIFHDVFGHVPLHADPEFAVALQQLGALSAAASMPADVEALARLFWFTIEFGLVRERGRVRVYGSGLISSHLDAANALSARCERRPFDLDAVLDQSFAIDDLQPVLFVLEDFAQLNEALDDMARRLDRH